MFREGKVCNDLPIELLADVAQVLFAEFDLNEALAFGLVHASDVCNGTLESFDDFGRRPLVNHVLQVVSNRMQKVILGLCWVRFDD